VSTDGINIYQVPLDKAAELLSQAQGLIGYDVKNTLQMLLELGCMELPKVHHDVLIGSFLLDSLRWTALGCALSLGGRRATPTKMACVMD
jgi:hypothetical protein